jgi:hypothetical protein
MCHPVEKRDPVFIDLEELDFVIQKVYICITYEKHNKYIFTTGPQG